MFQNREASLPDKRMRAAVWGGVGVLGAGLQPGGAVLLVHLQHPPWHSGQKLYYQPLT